MSMFDECRQGLKIMKFSLNHPNDFAHPKVVYLIGVMQFTMVLTVELANMLVICGSDTILDVIMNFIALEIIAEFDDFFYGALPKKQVANLDMRLLIKHTSSRRVNKYLDDQTDDTKGYWVSIDKTEPADGEFNHKVKAIKDKKTYLQELKNNENISKSGEIIVYT